MRALRERHCGQRLEFRRVTSRPDHDTPCGVLPHRRPGLSRLRSRPSLPVSEQLNERKQRVMRLGGRYLPLTLAIVGHALGGMWFMNTRPAPAAQASPVMVRLLMADPSPAAPVAAQPPSPKPVVTDVVTEKKSPPTRKILMARKPAPAAVPAPRTPPPKAERAMAPQSPQSLAASQSAPVPAAVPMPPRELAVQCSYRPAPVYPAFARRRGWSGGVRLQIALSARGGIQAVAVDQSSGFAVLDEAAVAAVRRWRCQPALKDGLPVASLAVQRIEFSLR